MNTIKLFVTNFVLLLLILLSTTIMNANTQAIDFKLKNGLSVILLHDPTSSITTVKTIVKVGSI